MDAAPYASPAETPPREPAACGADDNRGRPARELDAKAERCLDDTSGPVGLESSYGDHVLDDKHGLFDLFFHHGSHLLFHWCAWGRGLGEPIFLLRKVFIFPLTARASMHPF